MTTQEKGRGRGITVARTLAGGAALAVALTACSIDSTLRVEDPDVVQPEQLTSKEALPAVYGSVLSAFQFGVAGGGTNEGIIQMGALFSDELLNSESFPTRIEVDKRAIREVNATTVGTYRELHRARAFAESGAERFAALDPTNPQHAEILALAGYTYIMFAEHYCSGVPFSKAKPDGTFEYGASETTTQMLQRAIARFDAALAIVGPNTSIGRLARIGKARALVNLNDFPAAVAALGTGTADSIPSEYRYDVLHSENTTRQNNAIFAFAENARRFTVPESEGGNGLPYRTIGATDARNPVRNKRAGFESTTRLWVTARYFDRTRPMTIASGSEARLIEAENAMRNNDPITMEAKLNEARATTQIYQFQPGIANTTSRPGPITGTATLTRREQEDLLFRERAITLFITGHRVGDLRRLIRQYGRTGTATDPGAAVFPTGNYPRPAIGGTYGGDVNFPIPFEEQNNTNPNGKTCLDRSA